MKPQQKRSGEDASIFTGGGVFSANNRFSTRARSGDFSLDGSDSTYRVRMKRIVDLLLVVATAPVWVPVMACCALLIKISDPAAPIFYKQARTGYRGRRFYIYKFRSMAANADEVKEKYRDQSLVPWPDFKMDKDPRITPVGRIFRKYSIDEIPQIFNVLRGDMALIGPRPTSFDKSTYKLWQIERLDVVPGLSGSWQVGVRGEVDFDERSRMDIAYLRDSSLLKDFLLLLKTLPAMKRGR